MAAKWKSEKWQEKKPWKHVAVLWSDACTVHGWKADAVPAPRCVTVGMLVERTNKHISVAQTVAQDGDRAEITTIPRGMVMKITNCGTVRF